MVDFSKVRKGSLVRLASGEVMTVSGLYLSQNGPILMLKKSPSQVSAQNVSLDDVTEIVED